MKKSLLFLIAAVILLSCEKSSMNEEVVTTQDQDVVQKEPIDWPKHLNRVYRLDWPNQGDEWCGLPRMDCWDDIIIRPDKSNVFLVFQDFIASYNSGNLIYFFSGETYTVLFPYMTIEIRDYILNNVYNLQLRKNSKEQNTQIVVVQDQEGNVISAYPLNIQE